MLTPLSGTIVDVARIDTGAHQCLPVGTNTRPKRRRAKVTGRHGSGAALGAAAGRHHGNAEPARTNHLTPARTTPEKETVLIIQTQRELAAARAVIPQSARDGETRPALWRLAGSPVHGSVRSRITVRAHRRPPAPAVTAAAPAGAGAAAAVTAARTAATAAAASAHHTVTTAKAAHTTPQLHTSSTHTHTAV